MEVRPTALADVLVFVPTPHRDHRGFFTRTFDATVARAHGVDPASFVQESQSRSTLGTVRGLHTRGGRGEAKLVRCARGAIHDVVVDARPESRTFGRHEAFRLDDEQFWHVYIPSGLLHGFQVLSDVADVCYRIDREHDPSEDRAVRYDDPDLAITWPLPVAEMSPRDAAAGSWADLVKGMSSSGLRSRSTVTRRPAGEPPGA